MRPQIDNMVRQNKVGQDAGILGLTESPVTAPGSSTNMPPQGLSKVNTVSTVHEVESLLDDAKSKCAVIFFTSATCGPCRPLYPVFDELAEEAGARATFIKVDIGRAYDASMKYGIKATPTFVTFLQGEKETQWSGANESLLRGNVRMLLEMSFPPHRHQALKLPALRTAGTQPVLFSKMPPLDKLVAKLGPAGQDPSITGVRAFITTRVNSGAAEAHLPHLDTLSLFLRDATTKLEPDTMFAVIDLLRIALVDPRFSAYFAEEKDHKTITSILNYVNHQKDCPYSLRLVALQMACNLFSTPLYPTQILTNAILRTPIITLITASLLDSTHHVVRVSAASLAFNLATANSKSRTESQTEALPEDDQVELAASLLESIGLEKDSVEALRGYLLAFGYLVYCAPIGGDLVDLLKAMDAKGAVEAKMEVFGGKEPLVKEIYEELLGKGL